MAMGIERKGWIAYLLAKWKPEDLSTNDKGLLSKAEIGLSPRSTTYKLCEYVV